MVQGQVHQHGQPQVVRRVDQRAQLVGRAVRRVGRHQVFGRVPPLVRRLVDRQQLHGAKPHRRHVLQPRLCGCKGALLGERADVQLVDDVRVSRGSLPQRGPWVGVVHVDKAPLGVGVDPAGIGVAAHHLLDRLVDGGVALHLGGWLRLLRQTSVALTAALASANSGALLQVVCQRIHPSYHGGSQRGKEAVDSTGTAALPHRGPWADGLGGVEGGRGGRLAHGAQVQLVGIPVLKQACEGVRESCVPPRAVTCLQGSGPGRCPFSLETAAAQSLAALQARCAPTARAAPTPCVVVWGHA